MNEIVSNNGIESVRPRKKRILLIGSIFGTRSNKERRDKNIQSSDSEKRIVGDRRLHSFLTFPDLNHQNRLRGSLETLGFEVTTVVNTKQLIEVLEKDDEPYDMVVWGSDLVQSVSELDNDRVVSQSYGLPEILGRESEFNYERYRGLSYLIAEIYSKKSVSNRLSKLTRGKVMFYLEQKYGDPKIYDGLDVTLVDQKDMYNFPNIRDEIVRKYEASTLKQKIRDIFKKLFVIS